MWHRTAPSGDQRAFYVGVRDAIRRTSPNPVPPIQAIAVMAVLEDAVRSASVASYVPLSMSPTERAQFQASLLEQQPDFDGRARAGLR